jgi:outer membrane protein OmpA-like peptidoglycan-associated protein
MKRFRLFRLTAGGLLTFFLLFLSSCAMSKTQKGAAVGAGAGAVVGGAVGKAVGSTAKGALVGAVVGGTAGAIIGAQMDEQAETLEEELPNATVQRVGEGIAVTFDSGLLFDFDSYTLRAEARDNLANLAESLNGYPESDVLIVGHTDSVGHQNYNQILSENRAGAAATFLMEQGVEPGRIETRGMGEEEPIATNETEEGRQLNRRVEVAIFASEEYRERLTGGGS